MRRLTSLILFLGLLSLCTMLVQADDFRNLKSIKPTSSELSVPEKPVLTGKGGQAFQGYLRVYVVETVSTKWKDATGRYFNHTFLDTAAERSLSMAYQETFTVNTTWDGNTVYYNETSNFGDITEDNIMVIAAVYDSVPHEACSHDVSEPDPEDYFTTYYCDAAAAATPGNPGSNTVTEGYTHTILIEEGATST